MLDKYRSKYGVVKLCKLLGISVSSYYKYKKRVKPKKELQDEFLCKIIKKFHKKYKENLGYRKMTIFINRIYNTSYSRGYIHRLMKFLNIKSRIRKKKSNRNKSNCYHIADNKLNREFYSNNINEKWLTDVTEFKVGNNKLFLSAIIDLFDNSIISYKISNRNNNELVFSTFDSAIKKYPKGCKLFHSDRGFQYTSFRFKQKLEKKGIIQSMSRAGKCIDNAPIESFWGVLKTEMFYGMKFSSVKKLEKEIRKYIKFYNNDRYQVALNGLTPMEFRKLDNEKF